MIADNFKDWGKRALTEDWSVLEVDFGNAVSVCERNSGRCWLFSCEFLGTFRDKDDNWRRALDRALAHFLNAP